MTILTNPQNNFPKGTKKNPTSFKKVHFHLTEHHSPTTAGQCSLIVCSVVFQSFTELHEPWIWSAHQGLEFGFHKRPQSWLSSVNQPFFWWLSEEGFLQPRTTPFLLPQTHDHVPCFRCKGHPHPVYGELWKPGRYASSPNTDWVRGKGVERWACQNHLRSLSLCRKALFLPMFQFTP